MPLIGRSSADDAEHAFGMTQDPRCELLESCQPVTPRRPGRPRRDLVDDRQHEGFQVLQVRAVAFEPLHSRAAGILFRLALDLHPVLALEPVETTVPALRITADHGGFDDQGFPLPRCAKRTVDHGRLGPASSTLTSRWIDSAAVRSASSTIAWRTPRHPAQRTRTLSACHSAAGTCASDRYSANRLAESFSQAQARIARKARPAGCGRRVPRSNQAGIPLGP